MSTRTPPRLAVYLLHRFSNNEPLAGDLVEAFHHGRSRAWFWIQVLSAIVVAVFRRPDEVRPLHLVEERLTPLTPRPSRAMPRRINLTASPIHGIGGASILTLVLLTTVFRPAAWSFMGVALGAGLLFGVLRIIITRRQSALEERQRRYVLMGR